MKKLIAKYRNFDREKSRRIWLETRTGAAAGETAESDNESLDEALSSPLRFGTRQMKLLEQNVDQLTDAQKLRFQDVVKYYLTQAAGVTLGNVPPRVLTRLEHSPLKKWLSQSVRTQLVQILDDRVEQLGKIVSKSADQWNPHQASTVCSLYRRLRKFAVGSNGKRSELFETTRKKLIEYSIGLLRRGSVSEQVQETIEKVAEQSNRSKPLDSQEKLFVAEVFRMFPQDSDWVDNCDSQQARQYTKDAIKELKEHPSNPNFLNGWELFEDLTQGDDEISAEVAQELGRENLEKFLGRARATQFLKWARTNRAFLPEHLRAIQQISSFPEFLPENFSESEWDDLTPEAEQIRKLEKERREAQKKYDQEKNAEIERLQKRNPDNAQVQKLAEIRVSRGETYDKFWTDQVSKIDELIEQWDHIRSFSVKSAERRAETLTGRLSIEDKKDTELKIKYEKEQEEHVQQYKKKLQEALEKFQEARTRAASIVPPADTNDVAAMDLYRRSQRDFVEDFENLIARHLPFREEVETEVPFLKNLRESTKTFFDNNRKLEDDEKSAVDLMPFSESFRGKLKKLEEVQKNLKEKQDDLGREQSLKKEWGEIFSNPGEIASGVEKSFWEDLKNRLKNHQLHAADFQILWNEEFGDTVHEKIGTIPQWEKIAEFREKFTAVIPGIFDGVSFGDDALETICHQLDERISYENLHERLAGQGVDVRAMFPHPQKMSELLEGAVRGVRDEIFAELKTRAGGRADVIWNAWDRVHGRLDSAVSDPTQVHSEHVRFEQQQQEVGTKLQNAQEVNQSYVDKLRRRAEEESDPEKHAALLSEAEKLEEVFGVQSQWYQQGGKFRTEAPDGSVREFWAPGKSLLNQLDLQGEPMAGEIKKISADAREKCDEVAQQFQNLTQSNPPPTPAQRELVVPGLVQQISKMCGEWPGVRHQIGQRMKDLRVVMQDILPDDDTAREFIDEYLSCGEEWLVELDRQYENLSRECAHSGKNFTGNENVWEVLPKIWQGLENAVSFRDGDLARESNALDSYVKEDGETLGFLDEKGFFTDPSEDKKLFHAQYDEITTEYRHELSDYEQNFLKVKNKLGADINNLSEGDFQGKYNFDPTFLQNILDEHENQISRMKGMAEPFIDPQFFSKWLDEYNSSPEDRANAIDSMSRFRQLKDGVLGAKECSENMVTWLQDWSDSKSKTIKTHTKFSLYDIFAIVKQTIEISKRRWQRRSDRSVAKIGMSFYGAKSPWGKEFKQKSEESEEARVKEFETQYGEYPAWDVQAALYKAHDPDEAKACIRLLLDKGFMKWDDPAFWRTLMRLSNNAVTFHIPEDMQLSSKNIFDKVRDSCEFIWSKETFRQWDTSFDGKLKTAKDGYDREFLLYENDPNARTLTLTNMLQRWKRGDSTNVDPAKFEQFISASFRDGKMNGTPDQRWYFLVMGATILNPKTGTTILSRDVFMRMNTDFLERFPHVEFFTDKDSPKLNGRIVPKGTPGAEAREWTFEDYQGWGKFLGEGEGTFDPRKKETGESSAAKKTEEFFYHYVHMSPFARDRVQRMERMSDKSGDHDDAKSFFAEWTSRQVISHLTNESSGKVKHSGDFWRTYLAGFDPYIKNMNSYIQNGNEEWGDAPHWQEERTRVLQEVGDRLRVALITTQTLQGNMHETKQQSPLTLDDEEWKKETHYSFSADKSREQVNDLTRKLFAATGGDTQKYEENLDFKSALKYGNNWDKRKKTADMEKRIEAMSELVNAKGTEQFFGNTSAIETALKNYCRGGRIVQGNFGVDGGQMAA